MGISLVFKVQLLTKNSFSRAPCRRFLGKRTNNFAEYEAVILALETLKNVEFEHGGRPAVRAAR